MITRRAWMQLTIGSISVAMTSPSIAKHIAGESKLNSIAVFNENSAAGRELAADVVSRGGEAFPVAGVLDPARKMELFRRLKQQPSLVIGFTDEISAFELQMAANDAFHHRLPAEQFLVEGSGEDGRVAWAMAPVTEVSNQEA